MSTQTNTTGSALILDRLSDHLHPELQTASPIVGTRPWPADLTDEALRPSAARHRADDEDEDDLLDEDEDDELDEDEDEEEDLDEDFDDEDLDEDEEEDEDEFEDEEDEFDDEEDEDEDDWEDEDD